MAMNLWQGNFTPAQAPAMSPNNSMVTFINDDAMAVNYPVAPGTTVALINVNDPENSKLFLKSSEQNGCPNPMRTFLIKEITPQKSNDDVVSRKEFEDLSRQLAGLQQLLARLNKPADGGNKK